MYFIQYMQYLYFILLGRSPLLIPYLKFAIVIQCDIFKKNFKDFFFNPLHTFNTKTTIVCSSVMSRKYICVHM